jgi:hypothetical protein
MTLMNDTQIRAMRATSFPTRGLSRSAGFLYGNTGQGRTTQDVDGAAIARIDQRKLQKGKWETHLAKHTTNPRRTSPKYRPKAWMFRKSKRHQLSEKQVMAINTAINKMACIRGKE